MRRGKVSEVIAATSAEVFDLVHDYARRLEWDTLLRAAYLDDGHTRAAKGATSVCVGRRSLGGIALKTRYVSFDRPKVAAVELVSSPPFFGRWAASIRHVDLGERESRITYTYSFTSKPRALRWLFEPIMAWVFRWETRKRLRALRDHFARKSRPGRPNAAPIETP
jgi:Polyketide cyclase / dehydrase and lipid transport